MTAKSSTKKDYEVGKGKPPKRTQFGQPEGNPSSGGYWQSENSISFNYRKCLKMTAADFETFKNKPDLTMAQKIAIRRVEDSLEDDTKALYNTSEISDRTEGKPKQGIQMEVQEISNPRPFQGLTAAEIRKALKNDKSSSKSRNSKRVKA